MTHISKTERTPNKNIVLDDEAYKANPGPILLLAGPGTGKTYQLARRVQFLTSEPINVNPEEITVITFTREAAQSMRDKISQKGKHEYISEDKRPKTILTMHALGNKIIAENFAKVSLQEHFTLIESEALKGIFMADAARLLGFPEAEAKQALLDRGQANSNCSEHSTKIIEKYEQLLRRSNAVDYDDQIKLACELLKGDSKINLKWLRSTKHLLIDEYQDINSDQFEFIKLLTTDQREGLFVVGDDDQSIYKFRGGSPKYIRGFYEHFGPEVRILQLQTSRRCPRNILDCANHLVAIHDAERMPKANPKYHEEEPGQVFIHNCPSDDREATIISTVIKHEIENATSFRTVFVLTPTKNYSKKSEETLASFRLNYECKIDPSDSIEKFFSMQEWINNKESNVFVRQAVELLIDGGSTVIPGPKVQLAEKKQVRQAFIIRVANLWNEVLRADKTLWLVLNENSKTDDLFNDIVTKLKKKSQNNTTRPRSNEPSSAMGYPIFLENRVAMLSALLTAGFSQWEKLSSSHRPGLPSYFFRRTFLPVAMRGAVSFS